MITVLEFALCDTIATDFGEKKGVNGLFIPRCLPTRPRQSSALEFSCE